MTSDVAITTQNLKSKARGWPFKIKPLHPVFGCEISGISLEEAASDVYFDM